MLLRTPVLEACQHRASSRRVGRRLAPRPRARVARAKRSRAAGPSTSATHILVSFDALLPETFWTLRRGQRYAWMRDGTDRRVRSSSLSSASCFVRSALLLPSSSDALTGLDDDI